MIFSSMNVHQIQTITIKRFAADAERDDSGITLQTKWIQISLKDAEGHSLNIAVFRGDGTWPEVKNETVA